MPVSLEQYHGETGLFYNRSFAPELLLGLAMFISFLLRHFPDFLELQSRSKFIITSLNKTVFFTVTVAAYLLPH